MTQLCICVCVWIYIYIYSFFFHVIFHHVVTQETGQSSLCCTVGPQYLSTPNFIVCILQPHTPHPSTPSSVPSSIHKSVLHVPDLFLFCRWGHFCLFAAGGSPVEPSPLASLMCSRVQDEVPIQLFWVYRRVILGIFTAFQTKQWRVPVVAQWVSDPACVCAMASSIPGAVQGFKDPALL